MPWPPWKGRAHGPSAGGPVAASFAGSFLIAAALGVLSAQYGLLSFDLGGWRLGWYAPWAVGLLWTFWFGWAYGAAIVFTCTLGLGLASGLGLWAVPVALADPAGLLVFHVFLVGFPVDTRLTGWRDRGIFAVAVFFASVAGGTGALVMGLASRLSQTQMLELWHAWWLGHALEGLLIVGALTRLWGAPVEAWKTQWFEVERLAPTFRRQVAGAVAAGAASIAFYTAWTTAAWQRMLMEIYRTVGDEVAREELLEAYRRSSLQQGVVIATLLGALAWGAVVLLILRRRFQDELREEVRSTTAALRRRHLQLAALQSITEATARTLDAKEAGQRVADHIARLVEPGAVVVWVRERERPELLQRIALATVGGPEETPDLPDTLRVEGSLAGHVLLKNEVTLIEQGVRKHPLIRSGQAYLEAWQSEAFIGIPIGGKAAPRGVISIFISRAYVRDEEELRLFRLIGQAVGAALERADRYSTLQRRSVRLEAMGRLQHELAGVTEAGDLLQRSVDAARRYLRADAALALRHESAVPERAARIEVAAVSAAPQATVPEAGRKFAAAEAPLLAACLRDGQGADFKAQAGNPVTLAPGWSAPACQFVPLTGTDLGEVGILLVYGADGIPADAEHAAWAEDLADRAGAGLRRVLLLEALRKQASELAVFEQIGRAFSAQMGIDETLRQLVQNVGQVFPSDWCGVFEHEAAAGVLRARAITLMNPPAEGLGVPVASHSLVALCFREGRTLISPDMVKDERCNQELNRRFGTAAGVVVPLGSAAGRFGILLAVCGKPREFAPEEVRRLEQVAGLASVALERARLYEEVRLRADELALLNEAGRILVESPYLEASLRRIAERVSEHFKVSGAAFFLADAQGERLRLAGAAGRQLHALEGLVGPLDAHGPLGVAYKENRAAAYQPAAAGATEGTKENAAGWAAFKSGQAVPMPSARGPLGVLGIFDDRARGFTVGEVRRLEAVARLAAAAVERGELGRRLEASETRVRELLDTLPALVVSVDEKGRVLTFNAAAEKLSGVPREEMLGRDFFPLLAEEPAEAETRRAQFLRVLEVGRAQEDVLMPLYARSGEARRVLWHLEPLRDPGGAISGVVGMGLDVSDRQTLEAQLRQAQKMESVGALAGGMAHDFNNLLGGILGQARLARAQVPPDAPLRGALEKIESAAQRGADLTAKLLAFARKSVLQPRPVDLRVLLHETAELLTASLPGDIEVRSQIADTLPLVEGDPTQLQQVLLNLAVNARDAMPEGGRMLFAASFEAPNRVKLEVADSGVGMSEEVKAHLFEPFFTTKEVGKGTGLGLSVVFGIVRSHGGTIEVQSAPGAGTRFIVRLPALPASAAAPAERPLEAECVKELPYSGQEEIMIVDDNQIVRETTKALLNHLGYRVYEADGGAAALRLIDEESVRPQVIVLDVVMPGLAGVPLLRELRSRLPNVKVILISGYSRDQTVRDLLREGALELLPKPFHMEDLGRVIRRALVHVPRPSGTLPRVQPPA
ncbi:MAG: GAF domain-containing protein [Planctomycetes bacterium]|nr:GAF domain-containing protein [Planctomycetota bacterium]